ncbi:hypothetical protein [Absidia glauca]|uniref:DUF1640 domain-containing protein n=1 Tax=Absidia glauca TaxID=4829 RepID=A0A168MXG7_ABSGL|nr:hypothetical protein [Absidia glauca]
MISSSTLLRSTQGLLRSHLSHGRLCKYYVTSSRPTEKPHTDLVNNNNAPLIPLPPIMHPPPIIHPSSNGSNDFVLLSNEQRTMPSSSLTAVPENTYYTPKDTPSRTPSSTLTHHFDTFALVERLETEGGFTRSQARFLMEIMQEQIRARVAPAKARLLTTSQLSNESHVLNASIDDLRNAVTIGRKNDAALLQAELTSLSRDIEHLEQHLNEDVAYLHNSIDLTLNDFRTEIRQEQKVTVIETQQVNHRLTVLQADANMALERLKWETIWQISIVITGMGLTMVGFGLSSLRSRKVAPPTIERSEIDHTLTVADMEI